MEGPWYSPACDTFTLTVSNTVWTFLLCVPQWIGLFYPSLHVFVFFYPTTVHLVTALYIFAPYSPILAFWLMFFVCNAILNRALSYLILSILSPIPITSSGVWRTSLFPSRHRIHDFTIFSIRFAPHSSRWTCVAAWAWPSRLWKCTEYRGLNQY